MSDVLAKSFAASMKGYFGLKPGQSLKDFSDELKSLTFEDKMEMAKGLNDIGISTKDPTKPVVA